MMRVLITGVCGFIGRAFARRLLSDGHHVVGIDNLSTGIALEDWHESQKPRPGEKFGLMIGDARGFFGSPAQKEWGPATFDLIIHCAAVVGGRLKIEGDPLAVATDLSIDAEFFNWVVRGAKLPKVIYFSSSAAYPTYLQEKNRHCSLQEQLLNFDGYTVGVPDMSYGFSKLAGEFLAKMAVEKHGLDVKIYRPFGGYGELQSLDYPFPSIIKRVIDGGNPVMVWGSGDQERDFIHVDDVIGAVMATMDVLKPGEAMNIGTGVATSFFQLAERAVKLSGKDLSVRNDPLKPEGVFSRVADVSKMLEYYTPKIDLDAGIRRCLDFMRAKNET